MNPWISVLDTIHFQKTNEEIITRKTEKKEGKGKKKSKGGRKKRGKEERRERVEKE